jgi:hypothetical protein
MDLGFICAIDIQPLLDFDRKNKFFTLIYEENKINIMNTNDVQILILTIEVDGVTVTYIKI